jgi:hypothetical protein
MQSKALTVKEYLASLPADRRAAITAVRDVIRKNLDDAYEEGMQYGMIGWYVPHRVYPAGYHANPKQPLPFAALASQKNHMALYLMAVYGDESVASWFRDAWKRAGKKLDMGKACVRFANLDDVALDVIGDAVRRIPAKKYIARYEATLAGSRSRAAKTTRVASARSKPAKKPAVARGARRASTAR